MMDRALLSVVIPVRNREDLIVGALESVNAQTYRPIEIIVVDDGSADKTKQVAETWASNICVGDRFSTTVVVSGGKGANAARNLGCQNANGELIAFLDSDDRWLPKKSELQVALLELRPSAGGAYCGLQNCDLDSGMLENPQPRNYPQGNLLRFLLVRDVTAPTSCWMVKRTCIEEIGGFDESLQARQDWDLWIRFAQRYEIIAVPEVLVIEGSHAGERIRSDPSRELSAHVELLRKYEPLRASQPFWVRLAARASLYKRRGRVMHHQGLSRSKAFLWGVGSIVVWPFDFDAYAALAGMLLPGNIRRLIHRKWNDVFGATRFNISSH
jgi:glycosyltransferase involved in cell wall biosynthesis